MSRKKRLREGFISFNYASGPLDRICEQNEKRNFIMWNVLMSFCAVLYATTPGLVKYVFIGSISQKSSRKKKCKKGGHLPMGVTTNTVRALYTNIVGSIVQYHRAESTVTNAFII